MTLEIRPYRPEETDAFYRVPSIVFGQYTGQPPTATAVMIPEWSLCAFEDGELATAYGAFPLSQRINGAPVSAAGISFVGTLPQFRRRGHLRKITETDFRRRYEEHREPIAILTASIAGIYQRYGYSVVTTSVRYSIDPRWIKLAPSLSKPAGGFRDGSKADLPVMERIYDEFTRERNGFLQRIEIIWDMQTFGIDAQFDPVPLGPSVISIYEEGRRGEGVRRLGAEVAAVVPRRFGGSWTAYLHPRLRLELARGIPGDVGHVQHVRPRRACPDRGGADRRSRAAHTA